MRAGDFSRLVALGFALSTAATAQIQFHFGVEAGVPLTDTLVSSSSASQSGSGSSFSSSYSRYNSETKRLVVGPVFRVDSASGLGFEFDALYQRIDYDNATGSTGLLNNVEPTIYRNFEQTTGNRWQFPLLIQYTRKLSKPKIALFGEAGPSISHIADSHSTLTSTTISPSPSSSTSTSTGSGGTLAGVVIGGGVDVPVWGVHLRPGFRYSRWFTQGITSNPTTAQAVFSTLVLVPSPVVPQFRTTQNEASFLVGVTF